MSLRSSAGIGHSEGLPDRRDRERARKKRIASSLKTASAKADKTRVNPISESTKRRLSAKKKK